MGERIDESKNVQTIPTRTYCKRSRPLPYCNPNCRMPRHWKVTQHHRTTRPPRPCRNDHNCLPYTLDNKTTLPIALVVFDVIWQGSPWSKVKQWPWPVLHTNLHLHVKQLYRLNSKLTVIHVWPCYRKVQEQPKVIICIILIVLECPMLHTKFQGHWLVWRRRFWRFKEHSNQSLNCVLVMWKR